jgi:hypothetical protein
MTRAGTMVAMWPINMGKALWYSYGHTLNFSGKKH